MMTAMVQGLRQAGLLPPGGDGPLGSVLSEDGSASERFRTDLLPQLITAWECVGGDGVAADSTREWLRRQRQAGARLTLLELEGDNVRQRRLVWWTQEVRNRSWIGVLSSHLGRELDRQATWFALLRTACAKVDPDRDVLVTADGATADPYVRRCAELFGRSLVRWRLDCAGKSWNAWRCAIGSIQSQTSQQTLSDLIVSPTIDPQDASAADGNAEPLADRLLLAFCRQVYVLRLRSRGRLLPLIRRELKSTRRQPGSLFVALGPKLVSADVAESLLAVGAVGWWVWGTHGEATSPVMGHNCQPRTPIIETPVKFDRRFLVHCTRRRNGPWPDQSREEFHEDLILARPAADHSVLAVLSRIIRQRRITAQGEGIRGGFKVVSLTAASISELPALHTYRGHRGRWDFEPFGLAIDRRWLSRIGAKPVIYGDEEEWNRLPGKQRWRFQRRTSILDSGLQIDWSTEREWRVQGDVDLASAPVGAVVVLVEDAEAADQLQELSPWPIVVVGGKA